MEYITNTTTTRYIGIHFFRFIKEATISPQDDDDQGSFSDEYFYGRAIAYYGNGWFGFGEGDECRLENGEYTLRSASLQLDCTTATTTSLVIEREVDNDCTISVTLSGRDYCPRFNDVVYYPADDDDDVGTAGSPRFCCVKLLLCLLCRTHNISHCKSHTKTLCSAAKYRQACSCHDRHAALSDTNDNNN